jgi:hypothetical protein
MRKRYLILLILLGLILNISYSRLQHKKDGFIAVTSEHPLGISGELNFMNPPDFIFKSKDPGLNADFCLTNLARIFDKNKNVRGEAALFRFVEKANVNADGNKCVAYGYKAIKGEENSKLIIWTGITSISESNLKTMQIDKKPFCVFIIINAAGFFPIPLNDKDSPRESWFKYTVTKK